MYKIQPQSKNCKVSQICLNCGQNNKETYKECPTANVQKCSNCNENHAAVSKSCPALIDATKIQKETKFKRLYSKVVDLNIGNILLKKPLNKNINKNLIMTTIVQLLNLIDLKQNHKEIENMKYNIAKLRNNE